MSKNLIELMEQGTFKVSLAALLHDIGKFAQRAGVNVSKEVLEANQQLYCPSSKSTKSYSHKHAAYTGIAWDIMFPNNKFLPSLFSQRDFPFDSSDSQDTLINSAAMHHKPHSAVQWVVARADRLASGFERDSWESYNLQEDIESESPQSFKKARLIPILELASLSRRQSTNQETQFRLPLKPLSPESIKPLRKTDVIPNSNDRAQKEYLDLWNPFIQDLQKFPQNESSPRQFLANLESLLEVYTHAIPSATVGKSLHEVSLFDHARTTSAIAAALWQYHFEAEPNKNWTKTLIEAQQGTAGHHDQKFLLVQGDLGGIQNFVFGGVANTSKKRASLLRGKSFYVTVLMETLAQTLMHRLKLPPSSLIISAAGRFVLLAANTQRTKSILEKFKKECLTWSLGQTHGLAQIHISSTPGCEFDFLAKEENQSFSRWMKTLRENLEKEKYQAMGLLSPSYEVLTCKKSWEDPSAFDDRLPGEMKIAETGKWGSRLCRDQERIGMILRSSKKEAPLFLKFCFDVVENQNLKDGELYPIVGTGVTLATEIRSLKSSEVCYDISSVESLNQSLFQGTARKFVNTYVSRYTEQTCIEAKKLCENGFLEAEPNEIGVHQMETLSSLALADLTFQESEGVWSGVDGIAAIKADVDNLGSLIQSFAERSTFTRMAALSRSVHLYFSLRLPYLCNAFPELSRCYTIFAGGDDLFLISSIQTAQALASRITQDFEDYACSKMGAEKPIVTLSSGISIQKPKQPLNTLARNAEEALKNAKCLDSEKNASCIFGKTFKNSKWAEMKEVQTLLNELNPDGFSMGFWYRTFELFGRWMPSRNVPESQPRLKFKFNESREFPKFLYLLARTGEKDGQTLMAQRQSFESLFQKDAEIVYIMLQNTIYKRRTYKGRK